VDNIVGSASSAGSQSRKAKLKRVLAEEAKQFLGIFIYLSIVFGMFVMHEWLVLTHENIGYRFYGVAFINALVMGKIFLVAENLHFGERFRGMPLVVPIAYKSVAFSLLLIVAYIIEESVVGLFHSESLKDAMPKMGDGTIKGWFLVAVIMTFALIPFFAYRELNRALGESELRALLFGRGDQKP
jgi:hypothetical protein